MGEASLKRGARERHWRLGDSLSRLPLFADLSRLQLNRLAALGRILEFAAHDLLFRAGDPIRDAYVLLDGSAKRATMLPNETEKVIELAQAPQLLSLGEIFSAERYGSSCEAITPVTAVALPAEPLRALIRQDRELSWRIIQALARRQTASEFDSTGYHYGSTGTQRVLDYLLGLAGKPLDLAGETTVTLNTSKKIIAARIDMSPESFSRSLRQLSDNGIVVVEGSHVHIQNAALLDTDSGKQSQRLSFSRKPRMAGDPETKSLSPGMLINLCGRPRMLAQRMATNWGLIGQHITPLKAAAKLRQLKIQFEQALTCLSGLGLPPALAERLEAVLGVWGDYQQVLFDGGPSLSRAGLVLEHSEAILEAIDRLASAAVSHANRPAVHDVNIAGRNRMLTQRIGKLVLFREWGLAGEAIAQRLGDSLCEFDVNLVRLKRSAAGIPELAAQLNEVATHWQEFESVTLSDPEASAGTRHVLRVLAEGERLFRHVDTAVKLYERLAK